MRRDDPTGWGSAGLRLALTFSAALAGTLAGLALAVHLDLLAATPAAAVPGRQPPGASAGPPAGPVVSRVDLGGCVPAGGGALDAVERRLLAAEVAQALGATAAAAPARAPEPAPPSADAIHARHEAERLIERARAAGRWTEEDGRALRELLARASDPDAVMGELADALNDGKVAFSGPVF